MLRLQQVHIALKKDGYDLVKGFDLTIGPGDKAAVIGEESKNEALTDLLREFGILEMVRTGMVALERGRYTIQDERKETLEFNLGKML